MGSTNNTHRQRSHFTYHAGVHAYLHSRPLPSASPCETLRIAQTGTVHRLGWSGRSVRQRRCQVKCLVESSFGKKPINCRYISAGDDDYIAYQLKHSQKTPMKRLREAITRHGYLIEKNVTKLYERVNKNEGEVLSTFALISHAFRCCYSPGARSELLHANTLPYSSLYRRAADALWIGHFRFPTRL